MIRTRSVLIDNTLGRIFRNVSTVQQATAANLIAGANIESSAISAPRTTLVRPTRNLGTGRGIFFPTGALISSIILTVSVAPAGAPIIVMVKSGTNYDSSTEVGTYQILASNSSSTTPATITVPQGHSVFFDILQSGSVRSGAGLGVRLNFFRG